MGGVHVVQRTTDTLRSFVVEATSTLQLPSTATYRANTTPGIHGAFPEFIHGFYSGSYGFDAGIMYKDDYFWLFYGPFSNTGLWKEMKISSAQKGSTLTFKTRLYTNGVILEASVSGGGYTTMSAPIIAAAYNQLKNGCKFIREICIAINPETNGTIIVPTGAGFTFTNFSNTSMEMANGTTATMKSSNSIVFGPIFDSNTPSNTYSGDFTTTDTINYVNDTAYGGI